MLKQVADEWAIYDPELMQSRVGKKGSGEALILQLGEFVIQSA